MQACQVSSSSAIAARSTHRPAQAAGRAAAAPQRPVMRRRRASRLAAGDSDLSPEELEAQVEAFMRRQAEIEGGDAAAARKLAPGQVLGADEVSEEEAKRLCREVVSVLKRLKEQRDMSLNEVRLTVAIEDPRARERRLMGMEDSSGISREEMSTALMEVSEGKIPADRIALRELAREMRQWPAIDEIKARRRRWSAEDVDAAAASGATEAADALAAAFGGQQGEAQPAVRGYEPSEAPKSVAEQLKEGLGFVPLYLISVAPVFIAIGAIAILFFNSLR